MKIDYEKLSDKQLASMIEAANSQILANREKKILALRAGIEKTLAESGLTISDIVDKSKRKYTKRTKVNGVKYTNPNNPKQTWTGKGRRPAWLKEIEAAAN